MDQVLHLDFKSGDYIYFVPHLLVMIIFAVTLRIKSELFKKERIERKDALKKIGAVDTVDLEGNDDNSLNVIIGRNLYTEKMMNSQMIGSYLAVTFLSAGVIYGNPSSGLLLLPSIGFFSFLRT
ncbi:MAG: hypothetical protein LKI14_11960 [Lacticaseibacillus paracasei]|jgi:hypothetical protein|nr:hypothetical protein [Lacticaseibacillus paracasei]MCI1534743.1 hypothetical protein [Lacticaseibacillus paracasei]MCI1705904.1 hypothetical protein [Lacticaseibacillus paracasei]